MNEPSLLRLDLDEKIKFYEEDSKIPNSFLTSPTTIIEIPTKPYVGGSHEINRNRRHLLSVYNDQVNEFGDIKLTNLDSITVNRNPISDIELAN